LGFTYQKSSTNSSLPPNPQECLPALAELPPFPSVDDPHALHGFVDAAAHANNLHDHHFTTGYAFAISGGVIAYHCKTQSITATSSTEAEFLAAVLAAKHACYLCSIMKELGFEQQGNHSIMDGQSNCNQHVQCSCSYRAFSAH
jgi:hypothetical protein